MSFEKQEHSAMLNQFLMLYAVLWMGLSSHRNSTSCAHSSIQDKKRLKARLRLQDGRMQEGRNDTIYAIRD